MFGIFSGIKSMFSGPSKAPVVHKIAGASKEVVHTKVPANSLLMSSYSMIENPTAKLHSATSDESQAVFKQAALDAHMTDLAYNIAKNPTKVAKITTMLSAKGVELHKTTYDILGTDNTGKLQGAIFTDENSKQINVAFAGTRQNGISLFFADLWDDVKLACGFNTSKTDSIIDTNNYILSNPELKAKIDAGYTVHYTGHSLGGHSANVAANLMATQISEDQVSVTTFDSAGGDTAFKNTAQYAGYSRSTQEQNTLFEGHNVTFDSRPNAINQCDYKTEITKYTVHNAKHGAYNPNSWSLSNILAKLNPIQLIKEHSLDNFIKVFEGEGCIVGQDNVPVTYNHTTTKTPVAFDEDLFAKIIPSPNAEYTMTKFDQVNNEHITIEFSKDALNDAYRLGNNDITNFLEEVAIAGNYHTLSDIASAA